MLTLGFDTAAPHCAVCILRDGYVLAQAQEDMARGQAERLFPLIEEVMTRAGVAWGDLGRIGVGVGPGNFTGIRISVAAARGLALSLGIPAVGVSALETAAFGLARPITAVLDARRGRFYVQSFPGGAPELVEALPAGALTGSGAPKTAQSPMPVAEAIARLAADAPCDAPLPKPLYLRAADAAPARDTGPVMLDAT